VRKVVTLTTDFGLSDPFVGIMKGVMLSIDPEIDFIDMTHDLPPQDIAAGAISLRSIENSFPPGTVHLAVVDPGVGTDRNPIIARTDRYYYVGPDNGIFTLIEPEILEVVRISNEKLIAKRPSATFHGRDIFAPAAARLFSTEMKEFGERLEGITKLDFPAVETGAGAIEGEIIYIDRFGNLFTNIRDEMLEEAFKGCKADDLEITIGGRTIKGLCRAYAFGGRGELSAIVNSFGYVEIFTRNGNAALLSNFAKGEKVSVSLAKQKGSSGE